MATTGVSAAGAWPLLAAVACGHGTSPDPAPLRRATPEGQYAVHAERHDAAADRPPEASDGHIETGADRVAKETLAAIIGDIDALKSRCPQLAAFDRHRDTSSEGLYVSYDFHTHRPEHLAGWRGGVPEPDDDGVWLYIDLHDPSSRAQLHTQPSRLPTYRVAGRVLLFIMMEGQRVARCEPAVRAAVERRVRASEAGSTDASR
jgi:hypothetical protein